MLNCIAIDDEPLALDIVKTYCNKIPFINLLNAFSNPLESLELIKNNDIDLLFLDIHMEDISGIDFLKALQKPPMVIFTTAYDHYALEGYDLEVKDYLLKPFTFERFLTATNKALESKQQKEQNFKLEKPLGILNLVNELEFIFIKVGFELVRIQLSEILYIEGQLDYLKVVTTTKDYLTLQTFKELSDILPKKEFIRIHKSYIISISKVKNIKRNRIQIINDKTLPIGNSYKHALHNHLKESGLIP